MTDPNSNNTRPAAVGLGPLLEQATRNGRRPAAVAAMSGPPLVIEREETPVEAAARRAEQDRHRARSWEKEIKLVHRSASLDTLVRPQQDPGGRVSAFLAGQKPICLLVGPVRHGKTTCGVALGNQVRRRGGVCAYWEAPALRTLLCDEDRHDSGELAARRRAAVTMLETADFVLIDELGAEQRDKPWGPWLEWLWRIFTVRAENGRLMALTMNAVDGHGEAITDQYGADGELVASKDQQVVLMLESRYGTRIARRVVDYCHAVWVEGEPLAPPPLRSLFGGDA